MKKIFYIPALILFSLAGCKREITDYNNNTKASVSAPATAVFLSAQKNLMDLYTSTSVGSAPFRVLAQSWTENTYTFEARYNLANYNSPGGWWSNIYTLALNNFYQAKLLYPQYVSDPTILRNDLIITDIMEVYAYNLLINTYGNVPYTQAENRSIPFPQYDDAKTAYYDLLTRLDTCIAGLNTSGTSLGASDQIYKGNVTAWKKFAATLKLKMAMLIADIDATTAGKKVNEAIATGVFASNTDNAQMVYDASSTTNSNPIWQALIYSGRHDFCPTSFIINTMTGWNDPRIPLYYDKNGNSSYVGGIAGAGNSFPVLSTFSSTWSGPTYPGDILDYTETEFLLAEAAERGFISGGSAIAGTHYNNAVTASILFWGGTTTSATTYLAQPSVAYATATGTWKQKIGYQKWIAFANRNWDSWTEIRRLGYPNIDVVSPPVGTTDKLPLRFFYPPAEQTNNPVNWATAVKALPGGLDVASAKLFWMQ
ncbi:SusD/RagB family nutrient-binding outer membrane lipoprotein [Chitinophagaceae bacterium LWZ2-11]